MEKLVLSSTLLDLELLPPSLEPGQSYTFNILVGQDCDYTYSDWSERKENKLESGQRKLESG
jgi:hypothetical protein